MSKTNLTCSEFKSLIEHNKAQGRKTYLFINNKI